MHATSKLIIPAKSAQDSPYVPKIRIFLRPSSSLGNTSDMGTSLGTDNLMMDLAQLNHSEENRIDQTINTQGSDISLSIEHSQGDVSLMSSQEQIRPSRKRKHIGSTDNYDLELPNSALTKVNLSEIINMKSFESLPIESRKKLLTYLPIHDRQPPADVSNSSGEFDLWIHPTALRNEFLSKAFHDYSTRQMNGDFSPRLNSRQGLRKSVGNRQRYSNPTSSPPLPVLPSSSQSSSTIQSPTSTKENPPNHPLPPTKQSTGVVAKTNGSVDNVNGSRFRNKLSALQTALTKREPMEIKEEKESQKTLATGPNVDSENGSSQSIRLSSSADSISSDNSSSNPPTANPSSTTFSCKAAEEGGERQQATVLRLTDTESATTQSTQRRLNMPRLESTLLRQNPVHFPQDYRRKSVGAPASTGRISQPTSSSSDSLPSSSTGSNRQPLVVDSSSSLSQAQHRTKILADVKKNFLKRKLQQQQQKQSQTSQLPDSSVPNQSNTSNIRPPVENQTKSSLTNVTPLVISPSVLIQPSGSSVSAPATPQHGVNSGGGGSANIGAIPVPSIFSNYIEAKIVVTPSLSGSSASSNDGNNTNTAAPDVTSEQHTASTERTSSLEAARKQSITPQSSQISPQQQPSQSQQLVSPTAAGGLLPPATTTRAYFVDGNNLSETLALLQSINPRATVTQQQFLLIPGFNKSHAILCRTPTPVPIQPRQTLAPNSAQVAALQPQTPQSVIASQHQQTLRRPSGSNPTSQQQQPVATNNRPQLILPVSREVTTQHQQPVSGMYREILPAGVNNGPGSGNIQRFPTVAHIQPQVQHQPNVTNSHLDRRNSGSHSQLGPAATFVGTVTPSALAQSAHGVITVNVRPTHIGTTNIATNNTATATNNTNIVVGAASNNNPTTKPQASPASFFQPPPPPSK